MKIGKCLEDIREQSYFRGLREHVYDDDMTAHKLLEVGIWKLISANIKNAIGNGLRLCFKI